MRFHEGQHEHAWRVPSSVEGEYGVLVACGPLAQPYWWLLCPATATLTFGDDDEGVGGCSDASCVWDEVHRDAEALRRSLLPGTEAGGADG